jgi:outer membrane protein OmpA-like peptidoglycan-associated protein
VRKRPISIFMWLAFVLLPLSQAGAQEDVAGSADHPMITRFEGAHIIDYVQSDFDEYAAVLSRAGGTLSAPVWEKRQMLEGKLTRILYRLPPGRTSIEVLRNHTSALAKQGFTVLFECSAAACGAAFYQRSNRVFTRTGTSRDVFIAGPQVQRYVAARLARREGDVYVFVYVAETTTSIRGTVAHLDVVEVKPMDTGLVTVNAAAMARDISQSGHVALYGIFFDTGSAAITAASDAAITEIAALLRDNPKMRLHIVGHTDTEGTFEFNMDLSRRRAEAVVQTLVTKHMIAAGRLQSSGVGYLAPVASNRTEEGRAKNRRVELVEIF